MRNTSLSKVHEVGVDGAGDDIGAGKVGELVEPVVAGELVATVAQGNDGDPGVRILCMVELL